MNTLFGESGTFDGQEAKIKRGETGRIDRIDVFYGGMFSPDGDGHGHVVSNDGENIHFWRLPRSEGGQIKIDDSVSWEKLREHADF